MDIVPLYHALAKIQKDQLHIPSMIVLVCTHNKVKSLCLNQQ